MKRTAVLLFGIGIAALFLTASAGTAAAATPENPSDWCRDPENALPICSVDLANEELDEAPSEWCRDPDGQYLYCSVDLTTDSLDATPSDWCRDPENALPIC